MKIDIMQGDGDIEEKYRYTDTNIIFKKVSLY